MTLQEMRERIAALHEQANEFQNRLADGEDLSEEENETLETVLNEIEGIAPKIEQLQRLENTAASVQRLQPGRQAKPATSAPQGAPPASDGLRNTRLPTAQEQSRWGFQHSGEFYNAVRQRALGAAPDARLIKNTQSTYGSEGVGEDGGWAVPPEWRASIMDLAFGEDSVYGLTDQQQTSSNQLTVPTTEAPTWSNPGGISVSWLEEAGALSGQKPALTALTTRANKLGAYVFMTDELLEDAPAMGRFIQTKAPMAIEFAVSDAILMGNGVGKPLGIFNSASLVSVTRGSASVVTADHLVSMWGRMPARLRSGAVWVMNQDVETSLILQYKAITTQGGTENVGGFPVFTMPGQLANAPNGAILGRPIRVQESCSAIGTLGDIGLVNFGWYLTVTKAGGVRAETSIHVAFDQDLTAFRFIFRVGGQPWLKAAVARKNGSNTFSSHVGLATAA